MKTILGLTLAGLIGGLAVGSPNPNYRCSLTGSMIQQCCCVMRPEGLYCPLAKTVVESCCCEEIKS